MTKKAKVSEWRDENSEEVGFLEEIRKKKKIERNPEACGERIGT